MAAIVVAYVDKPEGRAALRRAADEASLRSARLVVVNTQPDADPDRPVPADELARLDQAGIGYDVRRVDPDVEAADDLIALAEERAADLIVIGLRRRSPVGKLMLGNNAQRVLLDASCPVLTVKADLET